MSTADDMIGDPIAREIWDMKYRLKQPDGEPVDQTVEEPWRRVATAGGQAEAPRHARIGRKISTISSPAIASFPPAAFCPAPAAAAR